MTTARPMAQPGVLIPPELLRSVPRPVALNRQGIAALVVAGVVALAGIVGGVLLYGVAVRDEMRAHEWTGDSRATQAQVTQVGRTRGDHPQRFLRYTYSVGERAYQGRTVLRSRDRRNFSVGAAVDIRYTAAQPEVSWMPGYEPRGDPLWIAPVLAISGLLPAALILFSLRRQTSVLAEWRPAVARVTRVVKRSSHDRRGYYRVEYEFRILSGATRSGHAEVNRRVPALGAHVIVLYDRERPEKSALYPLSLVRVEMPR